MKSKPLIGCIALLIVSQYLFAQDSTATKRTSYFKAKLSYLSDNVYLGRSDSIKAAYITPSISYYHKSGLFASAGASWLSSDGKIDMFNLSAGYMLSKGNWDGDITVDKYFYSSTSYSVRSEMKGDINLYSGYDLGWIQPSVSAGITFGDATDYSASIGLEHDFTFLNEALTVAPSFYMNAATQNYYNAYYQKRRYAKTRRKGQTVATDITASTEDAARFRVLDYELTIPIEYSRHRFTLSFTPTYAIPVNPNAIKTVVATQNGAQRTKINYEKITNRFFWAANVSIRI